MFNKKEKNKYYDFSVDLYTHGNINDKEIQDIKNKFDKQDKNKDDFELQCKAFRKGKIIMQNVL